MRTLVRGVIKKMPFGKARRESLQEHDEIIKHMRALSSQMMAYVCKTKNIIYRTATQKSIGIGQKVLYINGKKHIHTQNKKNGSKYIVQKLMQ